MTRHRTVVLDVVGLSESLIGEHCPSIAAFAREHSLRHLTPSFPAVTTTVQSTMMTGLDPCDHGIVGNGWYDRELGEVQFWKQSNRLVGGEKVWQAARGRDGDATTANLFWWYNMNSDVKSLVTPRPIYKADGRKLPDCYSKPPDLRGRLQAELGQFPLFHFWGPAANIKSTAWIAEAAKRVAQWQSPDLLLVYLPHLDYCLQQFGPGDARVHDELRALDSVVAGLLNHFQEWRVILLSEYGISPVKDAVHVNRELRKAGFLEVREEQGLELLDPHQSRAFAVSDHQVAHVYCNDPSCKPAVEEVLGAVHGVAAVLDEDGKRELRIDHARAGDLVLIAAEDRWFSYYYWLDDSRAPDFARTVDIHRRPGYDPVELFLDPLLALPKLSIGWRLMKKALGLRTLMDVIPLDATLVRGSHGRADLPARDGPVIIGDSRLLPEAGTLHARDVKSIILDHLFKE